MGELAGLLVSQGVQVASQAGSTYANAQAARGEQGYANAMTGINSQWSGLQQADVLSRADVAGSRARLQYDALAGTQRAAFAGNGVSVNQGSAGRTQAESRALGEIQRLEVQRQAMHQALGLKAENYAAVGQNRMRQIATRNGINQSYAAMGASAGAAAVRGAYLYDRYQRLGKRPPTSLDETLIYTDPNQIERPQPDYGGGRKEALV